MNTFSVRRFVIRRLAVCAIATALATCVACGGNDDGGGNVPLPPPVDAPNGARMGWNQVAASQQQLQSMTFRLLVDGDQMTISNVTCGSVTSSGGYECSGRLPNLSTGRHVITLVSVLNGTQSNRSDPLVVNITAAATQTAPTQSNETDASAPLRSSLVCTTEPRECFDAQIVASGLGPTHSLSVTSDGRLFLIEQGQRIRVIANDTLVPEPALTAPDPNGRIVGLAVDTSPSGGGTVFVAWTEAAPDGPRLNITRYRELQNVLGEGATIVSGLAFPKDEALAPLAVDAAGLLYVAMPAVDASRISAREQLASDTGVILRMTRDGYVPSTNARVTPIIAQGYSTPTGLAIDNERNRVWIAGDQPHWPYSFATFAVTSDTTVSWPQLPQPAVHTAARGEVQRSTPTSLSFMRSPESGNSQRLMIGSKGQISRGTITPDGRLEGFGPMRFDPPIPVGSMVQSPLGSWYAQTGDEGGPTSILRLTHH